MAAISLNPTSCPTPLDGTNQRLEQPTSTISPDEARILNRMIFCHGEQAIGKDPVQADKSGHDKQYHHHCHHDKGDNGDLPQQPNQSGMGTTPTGGTGTTPTDGTGTTPTGDTGIGPTGGTGTVPSSGTAGTNGSTKLSANVPPDMQQYRAAIEAASVKTGVPANRIAAVMWAESRGNLNNPETSRNSDGTSDVGLMQIGQRRYDNDIKGTIGGPDLDVNNPADNIMAGAFELKKDYQENNSNWSKVHAAYRGVGDGQDDAYANAIEGYVNSLNAGNGLKDGAGF